MSAAAAAAAAPDRPGKMGAFALPDDVAALNDEFSQTVCDHATWKRCTIDTQALDGLLPATLTTDRDLIEHVAVEDVVAVAALARALPVDDDDVVAPPVDLIDLSFLHVLRADDDTFIPTEPILVRDCMRHLFRLFDGVTASCFASRVVLVGSPGVGKSVLLLMAAVSKARTMPVIYIRESPACSDLTIFVAYRCRDDKANTTSTSSNSSTRSNSQIDILHLSDLDTCTVRSNISELCRFLERTILKGVDRRDYLVYMDGLYRHGMYDFFCSSEGYRCFKDEEWHRKLWILDAWSREEAARCLQARHGVDKVNRAYDLCGGNVRGLIRACRDYKFAYEYQSYYSHYIMRHRRNTAIWALCFPYVREEKEMRNCPIPFNFFAMFYDKRANDGAWADKRMRAIQYVDSPFALNHLVDLVSVADLYRAFKWSVECHLQMQSLYYKRLMHQWFTLMVKPGNDTAKRIGGINEVQWYTKLDSRLDDGSEIGLNQLAAVGVLWISGVSNDANIDAAIVHHTTLHVFEYVVGDRQTLDVDAFQHGCLGEIVEHFPNLDRHVKVHFVTPTARESWQGLGLDGSHNFDCFFAPSVVQQEHQQQQQNYQPNAPRRAREAHHEHPAAAAAVGAAMAPPLRFHVSFHVHQLDVCAPGIVDENVGNVCGRFFSKLFMEHTNQPLDTHRHPLR